MSNLRETLLKSALDALHFVRAHRWLAPLARGRGAIFMLHHVRPWAGSRFSPNRGLEVTPQFLDEVITRAKAMGADLVSMDEACSRIRDARPGRPFAAFTLDDGYRDNAVYAAPVFRRHNCPFTVYVPSAFADGKGMLWWAVAEEAIRRSRKSLYLDFGGGPETFDTSNWRAKSASFSAIRARLLASDELSLNPIVPEMARQAGFEAVDLCRQMCMDWKELVALAADPLVTIGAHTRSHAILAKLSPERALEEITQGRAELERALGRPVDHFAYPVGTSVAACQREFSLVQALGFRSAVTTRRGLIHGEHAAHMARLPRVSLNGHFQATRYIDLFLSGAPFALANRFRLADVG
jgi:peptidoglycan/xylan/chitin deacetylase (PgdA/CDA1 family)